MTSENKIYLISVIILTYKVIDINRNEKRIEYDEQDEKMTTKY